MAKLSHSDSRRMYSWWWDSHISPKNSKWLQENLTDMDSKVKVMIKLLEQDADSFAKRADMYYKQRPELMKLVEDFYRAYRALAERYDHATGVIRHAHRTMSEAFPNQVPLMFGDDSPANSGTGTPEMQKGEFTDDDPVARRKVLKQVNDSFRSVEHVRKGLNFDDTEEKVQSMQTSHVEDRKLSKSDNGSKSEDVLVLKEALAKLEAEKEAGLAQYQQSLDRISKLEAEISRTNEDFKVLTDHATKAGSEVVVLKESLSKLETEKDSELQNYLQSLERISDLQKILSISQEDAKNLDERATRAEIEAESLKGELDKLTVEKDEALSNYMEALQLISNLENKLLLTEDDARKLKVRAENAESEVEILNTTISKLTAEKEALAVQYQQCVERISSLEHQLVTAEKEAERLNMEMDNEISKLKGAEEQCSLLQKTNESLHSELELLMLKMGTQTQELTEKQKEVGKLWACVQEERLRFVEAETAFQTLQHLHAQTQEELRSMASELQKRAQLMNVLETRNQSLQDEVLKVKEENKQLDEVNTSSALSIKDLQNEISCLKESKGALEVEAELRLDQRNALQQEIYCLKEELNDMNKKHVSVLDQVHAVGLNPESVGSSVKELQDETSKLRETCQRESSEKAALLVKLEILEQLLEKNSILENTLSDLNAELEAVRGKLETLEHSCQSLLKEKTSLVDEKATLMIQLQETNENLEKLSENNNVLENSLSDANRQLEALKAKSKSLEDSCQLLLNEKASLISEKDGLTSELEKAWIRLEDLGKVYEELEGRCMNLEKEKESTLQKVEELQMSSSAERQERASYIQMSETRFTGVEAEMHLLREESERRKVELDQVIDDVVDNEIEIFVLLRTAQDLAQVNSSIILEKQRLLEECSLSGKKISQLEKNNFQQEVEVRSLSDQAGSLRVGTSQLLKALNIVANDLCEDKIEKDTGCFNQMMGKLQSMKESLYDADEENMQQSVELSILVTWIKQLRLDLQDLEVEKNNVEHDSKVKTAQLLALQSEVLTVLDLNEELKLKLREEDCNKESLMSQIEDLNMELKDIQGTCQVLQREKFEVSEEKRSLMDNLLQLEEKNNVLEEENCVLCGKVLALDNHSLIFRSVAEEKLTELKKLGEDLNKLHDTNAALMGKLSLTVTKLEESKSDNLHVQERFQKSEDKLKEVTTIKDRLSDEIEKGKEVLHQMELELQEAEGKMNLVEKEKLESNRSVEDLKMVCDSHENQILKLSEENNCLRGASRSLEVELHKLHGENNKRKIQEENLQCEMQRKINEINRLEIEAASVYGEFQFSMVSQLLYEQKFHELQGECLGYIHQNEDLKTHLAAFGPEIVALKESISSLENHTDIHIKFQNPESEKVQGTQLTNYPHLNEDTKEPMASTFSDLRNSRTRLQAIEKAAVDTKELMVQENANLRFKLDAAMRQLESSSRSESGRYRRNLKQKSEITEVDGALLTKDIMLDQVSDGSSRDLSKRQPVDTNNQIVELWEPTDPDNTIGLTVSKSKNLHRVKSLKKQKSGVPTSEKDLSVDKLEVSKRFNGDANQEGSKRKVLERLDSDVQKLVNLQITVQDLKRKLGVVEKDKRGKAVIECEALKGQLEEADMAILKLFDLNGKLMKNVENNSPFPEVWSSFDLEGDRNARRRRVSGQAAKMSEKIGRLQLEIQKLQFILLKFDGEKQGKTKVAETRRRILLRDYLYGGGRKGQTRKKTHFCACIQPSTVED